jgi:hypothetical protein
MQKSEQSLSKFSFKCRASQTEDQPASIKKAVAFCLTLSYSQCSGFFQKTYALMFEIIMYFTFPTDGRSALQQSAAVGKDR